MLSVKNLHASVDDKEILRGIDLDVKAGEVHAIMGPNGSGKSTLASVLAGNEKFTVTAGSVTFQGHDLLAMSIEDRARLGLFLGFQYPVEIPGVSMANFMKMAVQEQRKYRGEEPLTASQFLRLMKEKSAVVELDPKLMSRSVNEGFSGGEKKKNEIFQMAVLAPKLAILDETDSGLDIDALRIVATGVTKLRTSENATVVITHYQRLLDYIVPDYVHVLYKGRIIHSGDKSLALKLEKGGLRLAYQRLQGGVMERLDWIGGEGFEALRGQRAALVDGPVYTLLDPTEYAVAVGKGDRARLVIVHTKPESAILSIDVGENAKLSVVEMFIDEAFVECSIRQQGGSLCEVTMAELTSANVSYRIDLDGAFARSELDGLFLAADKEHCEVGVRVSHNVPDCSSRSLVKGVAGGEATGAFQGLVYVAPGAQRTDAQQTSRNVELSTGARIVAKPQLEIYADDVKCTHGATVGQMDDEAILYMRQRGLSEQQARRLQMEGFVAAIAAHCAVEPLCEELYRRIVAKLERM